MIQGRRVTHICYVSHDSLTEGIGMSQIRPLVKRLSENGLRVSLVTMEKKSPPEDLIREMHMYRVKWKYLDFGKRGPVFGVIRLLRLALKVPEADLYHCRGDLSALSVILKRKPFLWDVRGIWGEQKFVIGSIKKTKVTRAFFRTLEWIAARKATSISVLASPLLNVLKERNGNIPQIQGVIPTCVDLEVFKMVQTMPETKTILLSGVFNDYYDLKKMQEIIIFLKDTMNFEVVWCRGAESDKKELNVGEDKIKIKRQFEMPFEIAESTLGMAICKSNAGVSLLGVMPTKIAEFLAVGRPVIVSEGMGDLDEIVSNHRIGLVYKEGDNLQDLAKDLSLLLSDEDLSLRCRFAAEQYFDISKAAEKYKRMYEQMLVSN